jgi:tRNA pseudouridine38-40 synthase
VKDVAAREQRRRKPAREGGPVRYRARVEYDGTDFAGFQLQPGARTVQGELEAALSRLGDGRRARVQGAGRTDAGVHATGQVVAFDYRGRLPLRELERALDALLPADVALADVRRAPRDFRPRHATRREYRYSIWNGPRSPLHERTALGIRAPLDTKAMARAGATLVGRHDFRAFGGPIGRSTARRVERIAVRRDGHAVTIDIVADAFLRQMARAIVAALVRVGRGAASADDVGAALRQTGVRAFDGEVAPAKGLCLRRVVYGTRRDGAKQERELEREVERERER